MTIAPALALALLALGCRTQQSVEDLVTPDQFYLFLGDENRDGQFGGYGVPYESDGDMVSVGLSWDLTVDRTLSRSLDRLVHEMEAARCEARQPKSRCQIEEEQEPERPERCESAVEPPATDPPESAAPCPPEEPPGPPAEEKPGSLRPWILWGLLAVFVPVAAAAAGAVLGGKRLRRRG